MIELIKKDITTAESGSCILHQVNCFTMGSGVARALMDKFPRVYTEHAKIVAGDQKHRYKLLGGFQYIDNDHDQPAVINLFGQYDYGNTGRFTEYGSLYTAMSDFFEYIIQENNLPDIYIPYKMGCDRGGGDWKIVEAMIEDVFGDYQKYAREDAEHGYDVKVRICHL